MLSMRRCCPDKTLFTFVRVELISFLPFTDCSNCRVVGKMCRTLPIKPRTSVKSLGYKTLWQLFEKKKKKVWKSEKEKKQQRVFSHFFPRMLPHVWPHEPTTFTFMCVTGTYVDVNPLWRDGWCNICLCLCGCKPLMCVCVCSHASCVCRCALCVCVHVWGVSGRRGHNEMGG